MYFKEHRNVLFTGLMACLFFVSCSKESDPGIEVNIPKTFQLGIQEVFEGNERVLELSIKSLELYSCADTKIDYSLIQSEDFIDLSVNEIIEPDSCIFVEEAAQSTIRLGTFQDGSWPIEISLRQTVRNPGLLVVKPGTIELLLFSEYGLVSERTLLQRIPDKTIWGYVAYQNEQQFSIASNFINELADLSARQVFFPPGYYTDFTVLPSGKVSVQMPPSEKLHLPFLHRYDDDPALLKGLIDAYRQDYGPEVAIQLFFHNGETY